MSMKAFVKRHALDVAAALALGLALLGAFATNHQTAVSPTAHTQRWSSDGAHIYRVDGSVGPYLSSSWYYWYVLPPTTGVGDD